MSVDWGELFRLSVSPLELIVRGSVMFVFLWLLFRVVIKRRVGAMGMADLLVLVIIADAMLVVGTIIAWNHFLDWLAFPAAARRGSRTVPLAQHAGRADLAPGARGRLRENGVRDPTVRSA